MEQTRKATMSSGLSSLGPAHGTALVRDGKGIVLLGPSASGKSDLAFRLLKEGFSLIGDDQLYTEEKEGALFVRAAPKLAGYLEIRGLGIMPVPYVEEAPVVLLVKLVDAQLIERLPRLQYQIWQKRELPVFLLNPFEISAPLKLSWALMHMAKIGAEFFGLPDD